MRDLSNDERIIKVVKVAQKWLEHAVGNNAQLDSAILEVAFNKATELSQAIAQELQFAYPEEAEWVNTWVQIGIFAGFIAGWNSFGSIPKGHAITYQAASDQATQVAHNITDNIFEQLTREPKSPLISGLHESHLRFLKEALERSLFAGYLEGVAHAEDVKNASLSSFDFSSMELPQRLDV